MDTLRELSYIQYAFEKMLTFFNLKVILAVLYTVATFFFDTAQVLPYAALVSLVIADFFFGVSAAKKTGAQITSAKFYRTPVKLGVYAALLAVCRVTEYTLFGQMNFLDDVMIGFLAATELISILEKAGMMGFAIPMKLLNQLQSFVSDK